MRRFVFCETACRFSRGLRWMGGFTLLLGLSGCGEEPPPEQKGEYRKFVSFTNKADVVKNPLSTVESRGDAVEADFNLDGIPDLAVLGRNKGVGSFIELFIQKLEEGSAEGAEASGAKQGDGSYYRVGVISEVGDEKITGLLLRKAETFTDLVMIVTPPEGKKRFVHYRNRGDGFERVSDKAGKN